MCSRSVKPEPRLIHAEKQESSASSVETVFQGSPTKTLTAGPILITACAKSTPSAQLAEASKKAKMGYKSPSCMCFSLFQLVKHILRQAVVLLWAHPAGKRGRNLSPETH